LVSGAGQVLFVQHLQTWSGLNDSGPDGSDASDGSDGLVAGNHNQCLREVRRRADRGLIATPVESTAIPQKMKKVLA